jgi:hypothetical protein
MCNFEYIHFRLFTMFVRQAVSQSYTLSLAARGRRDRKPHVRLDSIWLELFVFVVAFSTWEKKQVKWTSWSLFFTVKSIPFVMAEVWISAWSPVRFSSKGKCFDDWPIPQSHSPHSWNQCASWEVLAWFPAWWIAQYHCCAYDLLKCDGIRNDSSQSVIISVETSTEFRSHQTRWMYLLLLPVLIWLILTSYRKLFFAVNWCQSNRSWLDGQLLQHGAIIIRGFELNSPADMEPVKAA